MELLNLIHNSKIKYKRRLYSMINKKKLSNLIKENIKGKLDIIKLILFNISPKLYRNVVMIRFEIISKYKRDKYKGNKLLKDIR